MGRAQSSLLGVIMNSCDRSIEVHGPNSIVGLDFLSLRVCQYLHAKLVQNAAQICSPFCGILLPFSPTYAHKWRGWGERGQLPLSHREVEGGPSPSQDSCFLYSSICTSKIGLNCSIMPLPANSVWNFVAFAHLRYLKIIRRFCVEGQAWVRIGVSKLRCDCS